MRSLRGGAHRSGDALSSCFYCIVGSKLAAPGASAMPATKEGFGTCQTCSVHACPQHGDRPSTSFLCVDCLGSLAVQAVGAAPARADADPADDELTAAIAYGGSTAFRGAAPAVAAPAERMVTPAPDNQLFKAIERVKTLAAEGTLGNTVHGWLQQEIGPVDEAKLARPLGLDEPPAAGVRSLAMAVADSLRHRTDALFAGWSMEPWFYETHGGRVRVVDHALRAVLAARGARSVKAHPLEVAGGLRLPVELLALLVLLQIVLERNEPGFEW